MMGCLVFNHQSLPFDHCSTAETALPDFLKLCIKAKNEGFKTILVDQSVDSSWFRLELAPNYFWQNWYEQNKSGENRDLIRAFRSIATQSPFFSMDDINNEVDLFEVYLNDSSDYTAIRAAAWHGVPLTSFATRAPWNSSPLQVNVCRINSKTTEIETEQAEIINFYSYSVFEKFLPALQSQRQKLHSSGWKIVQQMEDHYPGVLLCGKATQQLNKWSGSSTILNQVKQALSALSQFIQKWKCEEIKFYSSEILQESASFQVSGESATVRNTPSLKREREFWLPNGQKKYFEQHIKMSSGYRLHFFPDNETRQVYVGYIGPHLKLR